MIVSDLSDHFPVMMWLGNLVPKVITPHLQVTRRINKITLQKSEQDLASSNWSTVYPDLEQEKPNQAYLGFMKIYRENYDINFPKLSKPNHKISSKKSWMTIGLLKSCLRKERLYVRYKKRPSVENKAR